MNKEQLEIAKRIVEIEGVDVRFSRFIGGCSLIRIDSQETYNPLSWDILGPLMVKYDVAIDYVNETVDIFNEEKDEYMFWESFIGKEDIPRAILKCIITSEE